MIPGLDIAPCIEMGTLRAAATFQDPDVQIRQGEDQPACIRLEEGGVVVELEFPDHQSLARFQLRLASLKPERRRRV